MKYVHMDENGKVTRIVYLPDGWEICMVCDGTGHYEDDWGDLHDCPDCDGEGQIFTGENNHTSDKR